MPKTIPEKTRLEREARYKLELVPDAYMRSILQELVPDACQGPTIDSRRLLDEIDLYYRSTQDSIRRERQQVRMADEGIARELERSGRGAA